MSRIGRKPIEIPGSVSVSLENEKIIIKGKHGILERNFLNLVSIKVEDNKINLVRLNDAKKSREYHGLMRALIQNMVIGVDQKFSKILNAEGVGYKFFLEKGTLIANLGFTHPLKFPIPADITIKIESNTKISVTGIDKEKVGLFASEVRSARPPEPYKGKGVTYDGEIILRKVGKTGKK